MQFQVPSMEAQHVHILRAHLLQCALRNCRYHSNDYIISFQCWFGEIKQYMCHLNCDHFLRKGCVLSFWLLHTLLNKQQCTLFYKIRGASGVWLWGVAISLVSSASGATNLCLQSRVTRSCQQRPPCMLSTPAFGSEEKMQRWCAFNSSERCLAVVDHWLN